MQVSLYIAVQIVNNILDFLGHEDAERFTSEVVGGIEGFNTPYTHFSEQKKKAIREIGDFFVQPNKDLQNLMDTFFPDHKWQGLKYDPYLCGFRSLFYSSQRILRLPHRC